MSRALSGLSALATVSRGYQGRVESVAPSNLIAYWKLAEAVGATTAIDSSPQGNNGAYTSVTLGQSGVGDGLTSGSFAGTGSYLNVYSAALNTDFNKTEGTISAWARVAGSAVWSDGTNRYVVEFGADSQNRISILRSTSNNTMTLAYRGGNVLKQVSAGSLTSTGWIHYALTWSITNDQLIVYVNGSQSGSTQTTLTAFTGNLAVGGAVVGAQTLTPAAVWSGYIAHVAIWDTPLGAAQIAKLAVV